MDQAIIDAYKILNASFPVFADDILIEPDLRNRFLQLTREVAGPVEEPDVLRRLLTLRKRSKLPRVH